MDSTPNRPITDFYEFYWAHNMRGTQFKYMGPWIAKLVGTKLSDVPDHLKKVWYTVWGLILVLPILSLAGFLVWQHFVQPLIPALILSGLGVCFLFIFGFFKGKFLDIAGDAGRYFTPTPDNIMERSNIRRQGIAFLQKLHTIKTIEKPDRIIIVAHSLGAVVAYDLLRLLWTDYNYKCKHNDLKQPLIKIVDAYSSGKPIATVAELDEFQMAQYALWQEQLSKGNEWLITDFITVGAAVNAIDYFMVSKENVATLIDDNYFTFDSLKSYHEEKCWK